MPASYAFEVGRRRAPLVQLFSPLSNFGPLGKKCEARDDRRRGWSVALPLPVTDLVRRKSSGRQKNNVRVSM